MTCGELVKLLISEFDEEDEVLFADGYGHFHYADGIEYSVAMDQRVVNICDVDESEIEEDEIFGEEDEK